jgi:hypothetical protein
MFDLRLIKAEVLKLKRRRGMLAVAGLLTVASMLLGYAVMAIQHASDPAAHGPAGGLTNYQDSIDFLMLMAVVAGAIVGSTAGSQDLETGVFRDLAATGRSRIALFAARMPGVLLVVLPIVVVATAVPAVASVALAGSLAAPGVGAIVAGTFGVLTAATLSAVAAVALAALVGSRGPVIAILLAFELAISRLLAQISFLGDARELLPNSAFDRIAHSGGQTISMTLATAIAVVIAWAAATFAVGAWKTSTREI